MTIEEMRTAIMDYCGRTNCVDCIIGQHKLNPSNGGDLCISGSDETVWRNYNLVTYGVLPCSVSESNAVNHPAHYQGKHECIDEMVALFGVEAVKAFCKCNVYKYRFRAANKNGQEDLDKADFYMDYLMELEKGENGNGKKA